MRKRRFIMKLGGYLAIGLGLNVLVAWGCALLAPYNDSIHPAALTQAQLREFIDRSPWPHKLRPGRTLRSGAWGLEFDLLESEPPEVHFWHAARAVRAGLPLPSLCGERWSRFAIDGEPDEFVFLAAINPSLLVGTKSDRLLPLRPVLPGFLTNTVLYALLLWVAMGAGRYLTFVVRYSSERCPGCRETLDMKQRPGSCQACGWVYYITNSAGRIASSESGHGRDDFKRTP